MKQNRITLTRKQTVLITSLVTLLPILVGLLLWMFRMPDQFEIYLDSDTRPDAVGSILSAILLPPLTMLPIHLLCCWFTLRDPGNQGKNDKVLSLVFWIVPILSNLVSYMTFALAMGAHYPVISYMQLVIGLLFTLIGNYLPKTRTNATIGIRVPWVFTSRHNWNATHRFGGQVWMVCGLLTVLSAFLPSEVGSTIMMILLLTMVILPIGFSYVYYLRQKAKGEPLHRLPKMGKSGIIALVVTFVLMAVTLFTGDLDYVFHQDHMTIEASYYSDFVVYYDNIQAVEYRPGNISSTRVGGFGSLRLLMGYFNNEEFETYTQYTYFRPGAHIVLTLHDRTLVISGKNAVQTTELYQTLLEKLGQTP